jgi:hypothetical protein
MPTSKQVLDKARADIGVHETNGNNRTSVGEWFGWNGVAWCAQAVSKWLITGGFDIKKNAGAHELGAYLYRDILLAPRSGRRLPQQISRAAMWFYSIGAISESAKPDSPKTRWLRLRGTTPMRAVGW